MTSKNPAIREDIDDKLQEGKRRPMSYAGIFSRDEEFDGVEGVTRQR